MLGIVLSSSASHRLASAARTAAATSAHAPSFAPAVNHRCLSDCKDQSSPCKSNRHAWPRITSLSWKQLIQLCTGRTNTSEVGQKKSDGVSPTPATSTPGKDKNSCEFKDKFDSSARAKPCECMHSRVRIPVRLPPWCDDAEVMKKLKELKESFAKDACVEREAESRRDGRCQPDESGPYRLEMRRRQRDKEWLEKFWARERLLDKEWEKAKEFYGKQQLLREDLLCKLKKNQPETCGISEKDLVKPRSSKKEKKSKSSKSPKIQ